jgi:hypothetical protein
MITALTANNPTVSNITNNTADINYNIATYYGVFIYGSTLYYGTYYNSFDNSFIISAPPYSGAITLTGLNSTTPYYYYTKIIYSYNVIQFSNKLINFTTTSPIIINFITNITSNQLTLNYSLPLTPSFSQVTGVTVFSGTGISSAGIIPTQQNNNTITLTGLTQNTNYSGIYLQIVYNSSITLTSFNRVSLNATTTAASITLNSVSVSSVTVNYSLPTTPSYSLISNFTIYTSTGIFTIISPLSITQTGSATITGLTVSQTYNIYIYVTYINGVNGLYTQSGSISATPSFSYTRDHYYTLNGTLNDTGSSLTKSNFSAIPSSGTIYVNNSVTPFSGNNCFSAVASPNCYLITNNVGVNSANGFSVSFWCLTYNIAPGGVFFGLGTNNISAGRQLVMNCSGTVTSGYVGLYYRSGVTQYYLYNSTSPNIFSSTNWNRWQHICFTYNANQQSYKFYINGTNVANGNGISFSTLPYFSLGNDTAGAGSPLLKSYLCNVALFSGELNSADVEYIYNNNI